MGLDISFNRAKALKAGLTLVTTVNDPDPSQSMAKEYPDYLEWAAKTIECIRVPGADHMVENDGIGEFIAVRANKWGNTYYPLTNWLKANDIIWDEF